MYDELVRLMFIYVANGDSEDYESIEQEIENISSDVKEFLIEFLPALRENYTDTMDKKIRWGHIVNMLRVSDYSFN